jgi:hypothetical protein
MTTYGGNYRVSKGGKAVIVVSGPKKPVARS